MFKAIIGSRNVEVLPAEGGMKINEKSISPDVARLSENQFHVLLNHQSYRAEIVKVDKASKTVTVKVNGREYEVAVKSKFDMLLEKMGMQNGGSNKLNSIKAPMPGKIVDIRVKEGDTVKQHDPLLVLEAMKMENIIKAPGDGVVKLIRANAGASVEKNQVLIEFE